MGFIEKLRNERAKALQPAQVDPRLAKERAEREALLEQQNERKRRALSYSVVPELAEEVAKLTDHKLEYTSTPGLAQIILSTSGKPRETKKTNMFPDAYDTMGEQHYSQDAFGIVIAGNEDGSVVIGQTRLSEIDAKDPIKVEKALESAHNRPQKTQKTWWRHI